MDSSSQRSGSPSSAAEQTVGGRSCTQLEITLLNPVEAAAFLRLSKSTLDKLRMRGGGPKFLRFGRKILYRKSELDLWAEQHCFSSTSEYTASFDQRNKDNVPLRRSGERK